MIERLLEMLSENPNTAPIVATVAVSAAVITTAYCCLGKAKVKNEDGNKPAFKATIPEPGSSTLDEESRPEPRKITRGQSNTSAAIAGVDLNEARRNLGKKKTQ